MIEIRNLTQNQIDEEFFKKTAKIVLEGEHPPLGRVPEESELSIALVGQERMRELNKKYRGKNRITDVLAFGQNSVSLRRDSLNEIERQKFPIIPKSELDLGEIVICLREVKKNTKRFDTTFEKELSKVLIHGILHLLGYAHEKNERETEKMREKEEYYLSQLNYNPPTASSRLRRAPISH